AFNIANSIGAYFGGLAIAAGFGYGSPNAVAAALGAIGLALAITAVRVERRRAAVIAGSRPIASARREAAQYERIGA
ncbi:MAG TPA: hypothetical protein VN779_23980, partial [Actinocrinis sp.]|nr:hypothetical protein [Actinocrinis sp.]